MKKMTCYRCNRIVSYYIIYFEGKDKVSKVYCIACSSFFSMQEYKKFDKKSDINVVDL